VGRHPDRLGRVTSAGAERTTSHRCGRPRRTGDLRECDVDYVRAVTVTTGGGPPPRRQSGLQALSNHVLRHGVVRACGAHLVKNGIKAGELRKPPLRRMVCHDHRPRVGCVVPLLAQSSRSGMADRAGRLGWTSSAVRRTALCGRGRMEGGAPPPVRSRSDPGIVRRRRRR
jgi:hypothetical protein